MYIYDDYNKLKKDKEKISFDNYFSVKSPNYNDETFEIDLYNSYNDKTYYIIFNNKAHAYYYRETYNFTFLVYSTVFNTTISQSISFTGKKLNFLFYVYRHDKTYPSLGFKKITNDVLGELQLLDGLNYQLIKQVDPTDYFESYFENKYSEKYIFNLTLTSTSQNNDINKIYFYLFESDKHKNDIYLIYNKPIKNDTKEFIVFKELNLILKINSVPGLPQVYFGYSWEYSLENSIKAYGYSDYYLINITEGEELDINKDNTCINEKRMCEDFFRKIRGDLDYVVLKISPLKKNYIDSYKFKIKYGYFYEYSYGLPFYSTLIGIVFCAPNIIIHFLKCFKYNREHLNIIFCILDLIFWIGIWDIISLYIYIGGYFGYYVGIVLLVLYGFSFIGFYIYLLVKKNDELFGWIYFLRKLSLPLVNQAVNKNKSLQPHVSVKARSFHQESREI